MASGDLEGLSIRGISLPLAPDFLGSDQHMLRNEVLLSLSLSESHVVVLASLHPQESCVYPLLTYLCRDLSQVLPSDLLCPK